MSASKRHRDERGRAPDLLPAGPSACSEVLYIICLASSPGNESPLELLACEHGSHRGPCRGGAQGRCNKRQEHGSDAEERSGVTECRDERVQPGGALAHLPLHMQGLTLRLVGQIVANSDLVVHPSNDATSASYSRRMLQFQCGPREQRVQGGERRGVCDAQRGERRKCP